MLDLFEAGDIISTYSKAQAVEDGQQVQVRPGLVGAASYDKATGTVLLQPVYLTIGLYSKLEAGDEVMTDLFLGMAVKAASDAFRAGDPDDLMRTNVIIDDIKAWAVIDGDGMTIMLPEDY